jgi:CDGSH-type Zn-finger protein/mannose-6-phosphate isomerase-like protein (cupin superfamily)
MSATPGIATDPVPVSPVLKPFYVELKQGQAVWWCRCGRSRQQPYCDGSHKGTGFSPLRYQAGTDEEVLLCGCKRSRNAPHCDGTHNSLVGVYGTDDPASAANRAIVAVACDPDGKARIDGGCFVCTVDVRPWARRGSAAWTTLVAAGDGAIYQSQFCFDFDPGTGPAIAFGDRHVALLFVDGAASLVIAGRRFDVRASPQVQVGASVRPGEAFRVENSGPRRIRVFASVGPAIDAPQWPEGIAPGFDAAYPDRLAAVDPAERQAMAERYFQVLVAKPHGSAMLTQFIGEIPRSKAVPHRHLYEETLIVLGGAGTMWTETKKAPVHAGDVIFLPRKQLHSLECTSDEPMLVAGVIYPGDNPAINYY